MTEVLRKVERSLRTNGAVLIIQPAQENPIVAVEIDGKVEFREMTNEQNFRRYLHAGVEAIHRSVGEGLFEIVAETIIPKGNSYHCNKYDSREEWEEDCLSFCEDFETFSAMSGRIQKLVGGRKHRVLEYWKEYKVLLRNPG